MTLSQLIKNVTIQGDVRISLWKDGDEVGEKYLSYVEDLGTYRSVLRDFLRYKVKYVFCSGGFMTIELEMGD